MLVVSESEGLLEGSARHLSAEHLGESDFRGDFRGDGIREGRIACCGEELGDVRRQLDALAVSAGAHDQPFHAQAVDDRPRLPGGSAGSQPSVVALAYADVLEPAENAGLVGPYRGADGLPPKRVVTTCAALPEQRELVQLAAWVAGQMLDYAANAVAWWPVETLRGWFEQRCRDDSLDADEQIAQHAEDPDAFWQQTKTNLQAGRVRLLFVADKIPSELARIVEFLNDQMDPAEVLAVELRHYRAGEQRTLVPRVIGQTARAAARKGATTVGKEWNEESFFAALAARVDGEVVTVARRLLEWVQSQQLRVWWGRGASNGSFLGQLDLDGLQHWTFAVWTYGTIELQFQNMKSRRPFDDPSMRRALADRLNRIDGFALGDDALGRRPNVRLEVLRPKAAMDAFLAAFEWVVEETRKSGGRPG